MAIHDTDLLYGVLDGNLVHVTGKDFNDAMVGGNYFQTGFYRAGGKDKPGNLIYLAQVGTNLYKSSHQQIRQHQNKNPYVLVQRGTTHYKSLVKAPWFEIVSLVVTADHPSNLSGNTIHLAITTERDSTPNWKIGLEWEKSVVEFDAVQSYKFVTGGWRKQATLEGAARAELVELDDNHSIVNTQVGSALASYETRNGGLTWARVTGLPGGMQAVSTHLGTFGTRQYVSLFKLDRGLHHQAGYTDDRGKTYHLCTYDATLTNAFGGDPPVAGYSGMAEFKGNYFLGLMKGLAVASVASGGTSFRTDITSLDPHTVSGFYNALSSSQFIVSADGGTMCIVGVADLVHDRTAGVFWYTTTNGSSFTKKGRIGSKTLRESREKVELIPVTAANVYRFIKFFDRSNEITIIAQVDTHAVATELQASAFDPQAASIIGLDWLPQDGWYVAVVKMNNGAVNIYTSTTGQSWTLLGPATGMDRNHKVVVIREVQGSYALWGETTVTSNPQLEKSDDLLSWEVERASPTSVSQMGVSHDGSLVFALGWVWDKGAWVVAVAAAESLHPRSNESEMAITLTGPKNLANLKVGDVVSVGSGGEGIVDRVVLHNDGQHMVYLYPFSGPIQVNDTVATVSVIYVVLDDKGVATSTSNALTKAWQSTSIKKTGTHTYTGTLTVPASVVPAGGGTLKVTLQGDDGYAHAERDTSIGTLSLT